MNIQAINKNEVDPSADELLDKLFPKRLIERVLLIAPPDADISIFDYATAKRGRYWNYPPYGLGIIATHLINDNLNVRIINLNNEILKKCKLSVSEKVFNFEEEWNAKLTEEIKEFQPDIIGVSCMFSQTHESAVKLCNRIKKLNSSIPIAIGGVHITNCFIDNKTSTLLLNDFKNVELFFLYEAELAFKQFVKIVNKQASSSLLFQVYFNTDINNLYFSKRIIPTEDEINVIPPHDLIGSEEVMNYGVIGSFYCLKDKGTKITTVLSNRGCRGQCTFCSVKNFNGMGIRHRSIASIIDELVILRDKYNIGHIMWLDDDFLHDTKRTLKLFNEMVRKNIGITWDCTNGVIAYSCTDEIIAAAAESGCIGLNIGVESGNHKILKRIKKPGNINAFIKAAEVLKKYEGINTRVFLMIGFPDETYRMIYDTYNLAIKMDLDWYNITIFEPLPNTSIFESVTKDKEKDKIGFEDIRYSSGPYGKVVEKIHKNLFSTDFDGFFNIDLDKIPPASQLEAIWFYMNYNLNFERLFKENRSIKLKQQFKYVRNIANLVAPEDPFPIYFYGYLQKKIFNKTDKEIIKRLDKYLNTSKYWRDKFTTFNLSINDLKHE